MTQLQTRSSSGRRRAASALRWLAPLLAALLLLAAYACTTASAVEGDLGAERDMESETDMQHAMHMHMHMQTTRDDATRAAAAGGAEAHSLLEAEKVFTCHTGADCNGNGVCKGGRCMCVQPFTGATCERRSCPNQCSGTGVCDGATGQCHCYNASMLAVIYPIDGPEHEWGYEGEDCSLRTCFSDCAERMGHGRCNKKTGLCECRRGWWGPEGMHCNSRLCNDTCNNHGFCVDDRCICDVSPDRRSGWRGPKCELPVCPNHCHESSGLGRCVNAQCVCEDGWYGDDCSLRKCPENYSPLSWIGAPKTMCSGYGECVDGKCQCQEGFLGEDCSQRSCPGLSHNGVASNVSCSGHGTCQMNGACLCDPGFKGEDCFERVCSTDCGKSKGRGECNGETGHCACKEGWYGKDCSEKRCSDSCHGNGFCLDERCVCNEGFQGLHCEFPICGNNCSYAEGQGECINNQCVCKPGFNGVECLYRDCPKALNPLNGTEAITCAGNGVCVQGQCQCNPAWKGEDCATRHCDHDCNNVGDCTLNGLCICPVGDEDGRGGYEGKFCETPICPEDCGEKQGTGRCEKGKCVCKEGFNLPECVYKACPVGLPPLSLPWTEPMQCSGQGKCVKGACVCDPGLTGANCGSQLCPNDCSGQGQCMPNGACRCEDRFNGTDCSTEGCPLGCSQHGSCLGDGKCRCDPQWTGERCEIKKCPNACSEAGECVRVPGNGTHPATEHCACDDGFIGADCSQPVCLPLGPNGQQCKGKGRCIVDRHHNHVCRCDPPYSGLECGNHMCNSTCSYHGLCTAADGAEPRCECDAGWFGPNCDRTGQCNPVDCFGRGVCVAGPKHEPICQCVAPFGGPDCSLCVHNCNGRGTCTPNGCMCEEGWKGELCERREDCDPPDCGGHGKCVADANGAPVCKCNYPWTDFDCLQCTLTCNEHGECNEQGKCTCDKGWKGENCERYGDCPNNCSERGVCVADDIGDPVCKCFAGYGGRDCGSLVCNKTCPAHSTCLNDECVCEDGWTGDLCDLRDDCPDACGGIGTCMADHQGKPFCKCPIGRGGPACQFEMCTNTCSDHGACLLVNGKQECKCDPGFAGPDCSVLDCGVWADCGGPKHGECALDAKGQPKCMCVPPYTGTNCTDVLCTKQHCIHGTCANEKCTCEPGWKGPQCDYRVPCPAPGCGDEGRCIGDGQGGGKCECNPGFTGPNCLDVLCDDKCSGNGQCINDACECKPGFHGAKCEITAPCPNNCNGHGECNYDEAAKQSVCDCDDMWDSPEEGNADCSLPRGKTWLDMDGQLQYKCNAPYFGYLCQQKGCAKPCLNGGACVEEGVCDCPSGFTGADCGLTICPNGCNGGGECDVDAKMCRCFYGYSGPACERWNEELCLSTCSFKCSVQGATGLVHVSDREGLMHWVSAKECHRLCNLPTMCKIMFGSGHAGNHPQREIVQYEATIVTRD